MRCYSPVQVRASVDYSSDPTQYHIGYTSMFAEAVGVAPFKDNFWTTSVQPGNPGSKLMFTVTCLGPLVLRGTVGARHDGLLHQFSPLLLCLVSLRRMCQSTPRCCQSTSFSACPFFACLRLFPAVSLRLGRLIVSFACIASIFAALQ